MAQVPWNHDERLLRLFPHLKHLSVWVLEKHDLALSKATRCDEHDLQQLVEIHQISPFSLDTLAHRFATEMTHAIGDRVILSSRFLDLIETLFGEMARVSVARALDAKS